MFRTVAAFRSVASAALAPAAATVRTTALAAAGRSRVVVAATAVAGRGSVLRVQNFVPVRMYSAANGLNKGEVEGRIMTLLKGFDKVNDVANIKPEATFANLGLDSLDTVEVVMAIEEEFSIEIPDKDADSIQSIGKAVEYILNQPDAN